MIELEKIEKLNKAERRQRKKDKRKYKLHGGSLRTIYPNIVRRRAVEASHTHLDTNTK